MRRHLHFGPSKGIQLKHLHHHLGYGTPAHKKENWSGCGLTRHHKTTNHITKKHIKPLKFRL